MVGHLYALQGAFIQQWRATASVYQILMVSLSGVPTAIAAAWIARASDQQGVSLAVAVGAGFVVLWNVAVFRTGFSLLDERWAGTLELNLLSRSPLTLVMLGKSLAYIAFFGLAGLLSFVAALLVAGEIAHIEQPAPFARGVGHFYNGPLTAISTTILAILVIDLKAGDLNYLTYAVAIVVVSIGILMFSLLLGNFAALYQDWFLPLSLAQGALLGLTGVIIPLDRLPTVLEWIGNALPITHGLDALRGAFVGDSIAEVSSDLLLELVVAAGYAVVGLTVFILVDRAARRRGVLAGDG